MATGTASLDEVRTEMDRLFDLIGKLDGKDRKKALKSMRKKMTERGSGGESDDDSDDVEGLGDLIDGVSDLLF